MTAAPTPGIVAFQPMRRKRTSSLRPRRMRWWPVDPNQHRVDGMAQDLGFAVHARPRRIGCAGIQCATIRLFFRLTASGSHP